MYVGLIDQDFIDFPDKIVQNLEIMKLSSYFKKNNTICKLITNGKELDKYSKIYLRKNLRNDIFYSSLLSNPKCEYGGYGFGQSSYSPFDDEIEYSAPDFSIYNSAYEKVGKKIFKRSPPLCLRMIYNERFCAEAIEKQIASQKNVSSVWGRCYDENIENCDNYNEVLDFLTHPKDLITQKLSIVSLQFFSDLRKAILFCQVPSVNFQTIESVPTISPVIYSNELSDKEFLSLCEKSLSFHTKICLCPGAKTDVKNMDLRKDFITWLKRTYYIITNDFKKIGLYYDETKYPYKYYSYYGRLYKTLCLLPRLYQVKKEPIKKYLGKDMDLIFSMDKELNELVSINIFEMKKKGGVFKYNDESRN